ncbi:uncharacterized protein LOC141854876 [Brevipalpus obovatus]|uniref:uncharacterized protein LOC141854876 n=1 Tax=Brevipalpus obovatus TaxID=246614 RepID=UPI003D9F3060
MDGKRRSHFQFHPNHPHHHVPTIIATSFFTFICLISIHIHQADSISMEPNRQHELMRMCYGRERQSYSSMSMVQINGQIGLPVASSVESFIATIERIENSTLGMRGLEAREMAAALLKHFRLDGITINKYTRLEQDGDYERRDRIENILLEDVSTTGLSDTSFTDNERCSLFHMLSYHLNYTEKYDTYMSSYSSYDRTVQNRQNTNTRYPNMDSRLRRPREYGVASFRFDRGQAIAMNRVLLGVIAGYSAGRGIPISTVMTKAQTPIAGRAPSQQYKIKTDETIDPLMAVTLGDIMGFAAAKDDDLPVTQLSRPIGASGLWDLDACTLDYTLDVTNPSSATLAQIKGGLDGYFIGQLVSKLRATPKSSRLRLSQILRYYYDPIGARVMAYGYCLRPTSLIDEPLIRSTATNYLRIFLGSKDPYVDEREILEKISRVQPQFDSALSRARQIPGEDVEWCNANDLSMSREQCETSSDVIIAVDWNDVESLEKYKNLTARIINSMNLGVNSGSVTILTLSRGEEGSIAPYVNPNPMVSSIQTFQSFRNNLKHIVWNSHNPSQATCALSYFRDDGGGRIPAPSVEFYQRLNDTLSDFEMLKGYMSGAPSKVFILMGGMFSVRSNDESTRYSRYMLRRNHRDVPIILVTRSDPREMSGFVNSEQDVIRDTDGMEIISKRVQDRICETPSTFQHFNCFEQQSREAYSRYEGFITRGRKQYWAIYPEYFLKSYTVHMRFKAVNSGLRVCFGRYPRPDETRQYCQEAKKGEEIIFRETNPCENYDLSTCRPMYFTIVATDQGDDMNNLCTDSRCLNLHQTKFEFSHSGMQCSAAITITPTILTVFMSIFVLIFYYIRT